MSIHRVAFRKRANRAQPAVLRSRLEVGTVRLEDVIRHPLDSAGTINLQRHAPSKYPRCENQVWITHRMVGVQMRHEDRSQVDGIQRGNAPINERRLRTPDYSGSEVHQVRGAIDDDGCRRSRAVWIRRGIAVPSSTTCVRFGAPGET